jgi:hypothetical protein
MTVIVKHNKTNTITDWTQAQLDEQIALGNFAPGTTLANIVLPSDWNNDHTLTGLGTMAEQDATAVAITGGTINNTTIGATTATTGKFTSVTTPSVTATTTNLNLYPASTGNVIVNQSSGGAFGLTLAQDISTPQNSARLFFDSNVNVASIRNNAGGGLAISTGATIGSTSGAIQFLVSPTTSAVNYVQATGGATGNRPTISAQGSDNPISLDINAKGSAGTVRIGNALSTAFGIFQGVSGQTVVNYPTFIAGQTTNAIQTQATGTDTNISMAFQPKGTGAIDLAAGSSGVNISNGGTVTAITRTGNGTGYTSFPSVAITAPTTAGGVQAVASLTNMQSIGASISAGGTGYAVGNVITISGGTPVTVAATFTVSAVSSGVVTAVTALNFAPYTVLPTAPVSTTGGAGTGLTLTNLTWAIGSSFTISNAGSGYIEQPTITFSGGGGSGAAAYATVGSATIFRSLAGNGSSAQSLSFHSSSGESLRVTTSTTSGTSANFIQVAGGATGNGPRLTSTGSDTDVFMGLVTKGAGAFQFLTNSGNEQMRVSHTASAVNYVQVTGAATAGRPTISSQGSDTNIDLNLTPKGTGKVNATNTTSSIVQSSGSSGYGSFLASSSTGNSAFYFGYINNAEVGRISMTTSSNMSFGTSSSALEQLRVANTASAVNFVQVTGSATGSNPTISSQGTDTNIDLALTPKGTGLIRFGTYVAGALLATGYINIKAADGTTYKVLVST